MGIGIVLTCKHCGWKSADFMTGIGRNVGREHELRKEIEDSTDPNLAGARQALAEHADASVATATTIFQCPRCLRIRALPDLTIQPNGIPQEPDSPPTHEPPYWIYEPPCPGFFCRGRMSPIGPFKCPKCGNPLSSNFNGVLWD